MEGGGGVTEGVIGGLIGGGSEGVTGGEVGGK